MSALLSSAEVQALLARAAEDPASLTAAERRLVAELFTKLGSAVSKLRDDIVAALEPAFVALADVVAALPPLDLAQLTSPGLPLDGGVPAAPPVAHEGWGVDVASDGRSHYYRQAIALCGADRNYRGLLEPDGGTPAAVTALQTTAADPIDCPRCLELRADEFRVIVAAHERPLLAEPPAMDLGWADVDPARLDLAELVEARPKPWHPEPAGAPVRGRVLEVLMQPVGDREAGVLLEVVTPIPIAGEKYWAPARLYSFGRLTQRVRS